MNCKNKKADRNLEKLIFIGLMLGREMNLNVTRLRYVHFFACLFDPTILQCRHAVKHRLANN